MFLFFIFFPAHMQIFRPIGQSFGSRRERVKEPCKHSHGLYTHSLSHALSRPLQTLSRLSHAIYLAQRSLSWPLKSTLNLHNTRMASTGSPTASKGTLIYQQALLQPLTALPQPLKALSQTLKVLSYRKESTNISISKLIVGKKQNVLIWSAYYRNKSRSFPFVPKFFKN